jgi:L-asparaginase
MLNMKKILLIATGGTIASSKKEHGVEPSFGAEGLLEFVSYDKSACDIHSKLIMNIDSVNMNPGLVAKIAQTIYESYNDYDGFVITHGTDTLGHTSALLTYMLRNIKKPVILTGSQIPIGSPDTDATRNLSEALRFSLEDIWGVFVAFDGKLINGTRVNKFRTKSKDAFRSVNYPYAAHIESGEIAFNKEVIIELKAGMDEPFALKTALCTNILIIKLYPGMDNKIFDYLKKEYKGIIIESFGTGAVPCEGGNYDVAARIRELLDEGVSVAVTTQCFEEGVNLGEYKVGRELARNKIILVRDMATEAVASKLMWALGNCLHRLQRNAVTSR